MIGPRGAAVGLLALGSMLGTVACRSAQPAEATAGPEVTIVALDYAFELPRRIQAGHTTFRLDNRGFEPHQAQLLRLRDDVSYGEVEDALELDDIGPLMELVSWEGGANATSAGGIEVAASDLPAGSYVVACFYPSPDGTRHSRKGMLGRFEVVEAAVPTEPAAPETADDIELADFDIDMPRSLEPGEQTLRVRNVGEAPHEVVFLRLAEGRTADEALEFLRSFGTKRTVFNLPLAAPFRDAGGIVGLDGGGEGYTRFRAEPGEYLAFCGIPLPGEEAPLHYDVGMRTTFTVAPSSAIASSPGPMPERGSDR